MSTIKGQLQANPVWSMAQDWRRCHPLWVSQFVTQFGAFVSVTPRLSHTVCRRRTSCLTSIAMCSLKTVVVGTTVGLVLSLGFTYGGFKVLGPHSSVLSLTAPLLMLRPASQYALEAGWFASKAQALSRLVTTWLQQLTCYRRGPLSTN